MLNGGALVIKEACGNMFVKRDVFEGLGGFNEEMVRGEDTDLSVRIRDGGFEYAFLFETSFTPSSRAVSFRRICKDTISYAWFRATGKIID